MWGAVPHRPQWQADRACVIAQEELFAGLNCQPGFVCTRSELSQDLRALLQSGLFANVDARVQHKGKGKYALEFTFSENLWQPIKSFRVGSCACAHEVLGSTHALSPLGWKSQLLQPHRALL